MAKSKAQKAREAMEAEAESFDPSAPAPEVAEIDELLASETTAPLKPGDSGYGDPGEVLPEPTGEDAFEADEPRPTDAGDTLIYKQPGEVNLPGSH